MKRKQQSRDEALQYMMILRIKDIRKKHKHTQEYVIENAGVDVSHIESGRDVPNVVSIARFCKFYNITLDEFFAPMNYPPKE